MLQGLASLHGKHGLSVGGLTPDNVMLVDAKKSITFLGLAPDAMQDKGKADRGVDRVLTQSSWHVVRARAVVPVSAAISRVSAPSLLV